MIELNSRQQCLLIAALLTVNLLIVFLRGVN